MEPKWPENNFELFFVKFKYIVGFDASLRLI